MALAPLTVSVLPATAQDAAPAKGPIAGEVLFELQNDWTAHADDTAAERNDMFATIEAAIAADLGNGLAAKTHLTFEPVTEPEAGRDRYFGDQGLYVEALFLEYTHGAFAVRGGKFGQKFGTAWDLAPGIWGTDFAEDYELAEQIGLALDYAFAPNDAGRHVVTFGTFFADTTVLSESLVTNRHRARKSAGGAGNTEDFSSFSIALEGGAAKALPGLSYHLAYALRGTDTAGESDESGYVGGLAYVFKAGAVDVAPLVEYARRTDAGGTAGTDVSYLTTSVAFLWGQWNLALSRTRRTTEASGSADVDDHVQQISAGYAFAGGINVNAGYRQSEESGETTEILGFLVDYTLTF